MFEMNTERKLELFPDGTPIADWFYDVKEPVLEEMGKQYILTHYGVFDDGKVHTKEIQALIDRIAEEDGGVIVVPSGTFLTGALFFKQGVHLYLSKGATIKGSDFIGDYPVCETRMEGETCMYFPALINVDNVTGFRMFGEGVIDGNGYRSWVSFALRRKWNSKWTNKDEQRPRLVYISNCTDVLVSGLRLQNSHYWTNHFYKSQHVKYLNCEVFSPATPIKATSTDAFDIDFCSDVLIKNCYMEVNDDSVVLKGGKGPWADKMPENGSNERVIVEDCEYGYCHGCLTCGSESIHNRNILMRRIKVNGARNFLWLKMRPDTPQHYEYITIEDIQGKVDKFININPWTQFYDLKDRPDQPMSYADNIVIRNCNCECEHYFFVKKADDQYKLSKFTLENLNIQAKENGFTEELIEDVNVSGVCYSEIEEK